jgi:hypothetical protein
MNTKTTSASLVLRDTARADSLATKDPQRYQAAVEALVAGEPTRSIGKRLRLSLSTLQDILRREEIPAWRVRLSKRLGDFITAGSERLAAEVKNIPIGQLPVAVGIAMTKKAELDGDQQPAIVQHQVLKVSLAANLAEFQRLLAGSNRGPVSGPGDAPKDTPQTDDKP